MVCCNILVTVQYYFDPNCLRIPDKFFKKCFCALNQCFWPCFYFCVAKMNEASLCFQMMCLTRAGITSSLWSWTWLGTCMSCASSSTVRSDTEPPNAPPLLTVAPTPCPLTTCPPPPPPHPSPSQLLSPSCWQGFAGSSTCWWRCCTTTLLCCWTCWRTAVTSSSLWTGSGFTPQALGLWGSADSAPPSLASSPWCTPGSNSNHEHGLRKRTLISLWCLKQDGSWLHFWL